MARTRLVISLICLALATSSGLWAQGTSSGSSELGKPAAKTKPNTVQSKTATQPARTGKDVVKAKAAETDKQPGKDKAATKDGKEKLAKEKILPSFTLEREAAALTFVSRHHPDLAQLLGQLKASQPDQYERAIRELFKTSENLAQLQERDQQRYEFELESWRLNSRIQVLAARLSMGADAEIESQLRLALQAQADLRIQQQQQVRDRMAERLTQADRDLDSARRDRDAKVERDYQKVLQSVGRGKPRK